MQSFADHSTGARAVDVPCYQCGKMHRLVQSTMDLDGPSFRAYYCPKCAQVVFGAERVEQAHLEADQANY